MKSYLYAPPEGRLIRDSIMQASIITIYIYSAKDPAWTATELAFFPEFLGESLMDLQIGFANSWSLSGKHFVEVCPCDWRWKDLIIQLNDG